jgi:hypothetical protein
VRCRSSSSAGLLFALALLALGCGGEDGITEFATGQLTVVITTAGDELDADGYTVRVDQGGAQPIGATGELQFNGLESGDHTVTLSGITANCTPAEGLTQTVRVSEGSMATVTYTVICLANPSTGGLTVVITTSGDDPDLDGYTVQVDQGEPQPIAPYGQLQATELSAGSHTVTLAGVAANCSVAEGLIQSVTVSERGMATVRYTVTCPTMTTPVWARIPLPPSVQTNGLWGTSPSDLFATGYAEQPSPRYGIWHYDGSGWTEQVSRVDTVFNALWGFSATDVYAVGGRTANGSPHPGAVLHYDGSRWSDVSAPAVSDGSSDFTAVWGSSPQDIFVAGRAETGAGLVGHFDGHTWSQMTISDPASGCPSPGCLVPGGVKTGVSDLSGTSSTDVWVIGNRPIYDCETCWDATGTVSHSDGSSWTNLREHDYVTFLAIWASAPNDAWILGMDGDFPYLYHSDGTSLTLNRAVSDKYPHLRDLWGSSPSDVYAVGPQVLLHYDGSSWIKISSEGGNRVWGTSRNDVFVLRANEILHFKR